MPVDRPSDATMAEIQIGITAKRALQGYDPLKVLSDAIQPYWKKPN
jgi:hypothetical protein